MSEESGRKAAETLPVATLFRMDDEAFVTLMLGKFEAAGRPASPDAEARLHNALVGALFTGSPRR